MSNLDRIADALRIRICLQAIEAPIALHEHALSQEFSVSRTPIRQVLQRLANEAMVEIRPGVGTVSTRLDPTLRAIDREILLGLLEIAADAEAGMEMPHPLQAEYSTLLALLNLRTPQGMSGICDLLARTVSLLARTTRSGVLSPALHVAFWRALRWTAADCRRNPAEEAARCAVCLEDMRRVATAGVKGRRSAPLHAAAAVDCMIHSAEPVA